MKTKFYKINGLGNDYVFFDFVNQKLKLDFSSLSKKLSNRNFGIGSDGIVVITKSEVADLKMEIYNSDGSKAKICGNALRCIALLYKQKYGKEELHIETETRIVKTFIKSCEKNKAIVLAEIGKIEINNVFDMKNIKGFLVNAGNSHLVVFVKNFNFNCEKMADKLNLQIGKKANVEFVKIIKNGVQVVVIESGSGRTLSCGSGACATNYVCCVNGIFKFNNYNTIFLDGGVLQILSIESGETKMIGEAEISFEGEVEC